MDIKQVKAKKPELIGLGTTHGYFVGVKGDGRNEFIVAPSRMFSDGVRGFIEGALVDKLAPIKLHTVDILTIDEEDMDRFDDYIRKLERMEKVLHNRMLILLCK